MIDAKMLRVTDIDQPVVTAPAVGVNDRFRCYPPVNNGLQRLSAAVGHDLGVDRTVPFEDAEDDRLTRRLLLSRTRRAPK
jgi:hypothetical protein